MRGVLIRVYRAGREAAAGYGRHACSQLAAGIAYRVLFSLVPFVALLVAVLDLVLPSDARQEVIDWLYDTIPGTDVERAVDNSIAHAGLDAPLVGLVALAGFLWAATGMMASIRTAFRVVWEAEGLPFARGKLRDLALVGLGAGLIFVAFGASLVTQVVARVGGDVSSTIGVGSGGALVGSATEIGTTLAVSFLAFLTVYAVVPPVRVTPGEVWPSAVLATAAFALLTEGFSLYLARFADLNAVYGPLGAVFAFLLLVYLSAAILLFGAELAAGRRRRAT
jgi:membrane protein